MSLQEKFKGTGIAIVTPFNADKSIDWLACERLINFWIDGGVEYLVVLGTTGESPTVHGEEKQKLFAFVNDVVEGRLPLIAGIGGNDTHEVLENFKSLDLRGYDAILSVSPAYSKPNQEGIYQHYKLIDEHTPLPLILYNVPSRTGQNVTADTQLRIAHDCRKVFATKEASGDFTQVMAIIKGKPENFMVISGDDLITLPMIACGANGVISVVANAFPKDFSEMVRLCLAGRYNEALPIHYKYTDIIASMFAEGSPAGVKTYLSELKLCSDTVRMPVWPVSARHLEKIRTLLRSEKVNA